METTVEGNVKGLDAMDIGLEISPPATVVEGLPVMLGNCLGISPPATV